MERKIEWKKSLKIDEQFFCELTEIYNILHLSPKYIIATKENATYTFENIDKLLEYKFDEEITEVTIKPNEHDKSNSIYLYLKVYDSFILNYNTTSICRYEVTDNSFDSIIKDKIIKLYENHTKSDWFIGKFGIFFLLFALIIVTFCITVIYDVFQIYNNNYHFTNLNFSIFMRTFTISSFCIYLIKFLDTFICYYFFTPIVYYIGYQKEKWNKREKMRSNIFWGIIVAILIGIITTIITRYI